MRFDSLKIIPIVLCFEFLFQFSCFAFVHPLGHLSSIESYETTILPFQSRILPMKLIWKNTPFSPLKLSMSGEQSTQDDLEGVSEQVNSTLSFSPTNIWNKYKNSLTTNPLLAKSVASAIGFTLGDMISQILLTRPLSFNLYRTIRFALFGAIIHGPSGHYFYSWLNRLIPGVSPRLVATKVLIDQMLWAPLFSAVLFIFIGVLGGSTPRMIAMKVKKDLVTAVFGSWCIWPLAHAINFQYVAASNRLIYINIVQLTYNVFLSYVLYWPSRLFK